MWELIVVICMIVFASLRGIAGCIQQTSWRPMSVEERIFRSSIVAYGKNEQLVRINGTSGNVISVDSVFRVYCQLKIYRAGLGHYIRIHDALPNDICAKSRMKIGKEYIVGLRRLGNGNFGYHNVNYPQSAVFDPSEELLRKIVNMCGLTEVRTVDGGPSVYQPKCPVPTVNEDTCLAPSNAVATAISHLVYTMSVLISFGVFLFS